MRTLPIGNKIPVRFYDSQAGFSLLELIVVIAIVAMMAALSMVTLHRHQQLRPTADLLITSLREARDDARHAGKQTIVTVDVARHVWQGYDRDVGQIPDGVDIAVTAAAELSNKPFNGAFSFFPDGSSSGGEITLSSGNARAIITINWLTGRVELQEQ